jgi:4-oxalocrotonate tautomerase
MPFVHIRLLEGVSAEKKAEVIRKVTDVIVETLNKNPATTMVVIDDVPTDNWGIAGQSATQIRNAVKT